MGAVSRGVIRSLVLALLVAGCGGDDGAWTQTAGETTCAEWIDEMTPEQRAGLAAAVLEILWDRDGAASRPDEAVTTRFANAIGGVCASFRDDSISSVAATLYALADDLKPG